MLLLATLMLALNAFPREVLTLQSGWKFTKGNPEKAAQNIIDLLPRATAFFTSTTSLVSGWFDNSIVDGLVRGTAAALSVASYPLRLAQTGRTHNYALVIVITVAITFGWYWLQ